MYVIKPQASKGDSPPVVAVTPADRTAPERAGRAVIPAPGGRLRPVVGRAQDAAHEEAPISSGKALSMRPLQIRGVLPLGRATDPWPT
jgi:hypothetical protein